MAPSYPIEEYFNKETKEHRWRIRATNGRIIASSSEGYRNKSDMLRNLASVFQSLKNHLNEQ